MIRFTQLMDELDSTTSQNERVDALVKYFKKANDSDALFVIALFTGKKPPRPINTTILRQWAAETADIPLWLFEDSYHIAGDLSETISLLIHNDEKGIDYPLSDLMHELYDLKIQDIAFIKEYIIGKWKNFDQYSCFLFNKLLSGVFRIGVSEKLLIKALALTYGLTDSQVAHLLTGDWHPLKITLQELLHTKEQDPSKPYPFYLAYPLEGDVENLGSVEDWIIERKWDGIRGQIICRNDTLFIWSRGEELVTAKFPELHILQNVLKSGTVLDGEIMAYTTQPLDFSVLQTRIGRKTISRKVLEEAPVKFVVYDLLEYDGHDLRNESQQTRRKLLEALVASAHQEVLILSPLIEKKTWEEVAAERLLSREHISEGLMLKRKSAAYQTGRKRGDWWKWKTEPFTIDAVLTYAMQGHGRRANLFTDYTFAVWNENKTELMTIAKAYSGLTDKEIRDVDAFVKKNTIEKFGPVRSVKNELVFELAFEGIARSSRHKSGIALRFPRISRQRLDKKIEDANTIQDMFDLLDKVKA